MRHIRSEEGKQFIDWLRSQGVAPKTIPEAAHYVERFEHWKSDHTEGPAVTEKQVLQFLEEETTLSRLGEGRRSSPLSVRRVLALYLKMKAHQSRLPAGEARAWRDTCVPPYRKAWPAWEPAERFGVWLKARDYSSLTVRTQYLRLTRHFGYYLHQRGSTVDVLDERMVERFITVHLDRCWRMQPSRRNRQPVRACFRLFLTAMREEGLISPAPAAEITARDQLLTDLGAFIRDRQGCCSGTICNHQRNVRFFLESREGAQLLDDAEPILAAPFVSFFRRRIIGRRPNTCNQIRQALLYFADYLREHGRSVVDLSSELPWTRPYTQNTVPVALPWLDILRMLEAVDRTTAIGRRDYAMLLLMATCGLRCSEVRALRLQDIDWRHDRLLVRRPKVSDERYYPLLPEVGEAILVYLRDGRPPQAHREVFLEHRPPYGPLRSTTRYPVTKHLRLAGVVSRQHGTHQLRHSAALQLLRQGVSFKVIGDLLGHRVPRTTSAYTRVHVEDLRRVALDLEVQL